MTAEPTAEPAEPRLPDAARALLSLRVIHKRWGNNHVLDGVSLDLSPGELTWLGGRNGAGKTTLLRIAGGLIAPDSGEVALDGLDPERDRRAYQRRLGFLSAGNLGLYARLKVTDNLDLFSALALIPARERPAAVSRAIERFELGELARSRTDRLSTGQRQRVRLAVAFLHDPDVVLLDEPHTSLDDEGLAVLRGAIERLTGAGGAALWCSPTPEALHADFDRMYRIEGGALVAEQDR
ncbi:MAG: ABC transporter ATP-binding protein [Thermoleophilaceae bacterium]